MKGNHCCWRQVRTAHLGSVASQLRGTLTIPYLVLGSTELTFKKPTLRPVLDVDD